MATFREMLNATSSGKQESPNSPKGHWYHRQYGKRAFCFEADEDRTQESPPDTDEDSA